MIATSLLRIVRCILLTPCYLRKLVAIKHPRLEYTLLTSSKLKIFILLSHPTRPLAFTIYSPTKMPSENSVKAALSLIENDKSKILGLTVGSHQNVQPGDYIPRAGKHLNNLAFHRHLIKMSTDKLQQMPSPLHSSLSLGLLHPKPTLSSPLTLMRLSPRLVFLVLFCTGFSPG